MKKTIKTEKAVTVFNKLYGASLSAMDDEAKLAMFKICRQLKPIAIKYSEDVNDAKKKLAPYDNFLEELKKASAYELAVKAGKEYKDYTKEEFAKFIEPFDKWVKLVDKAVKELDDKEVELEMPEVTEEMFDRLCFANNWSFEVRGVFDVLTE